jgi:hypothetical protein
LRGDEVLRRQVAAELVAANKRIADDDVADSELEPYFLLGGFLHLKVWGDVRFDLADLFDYNVP